MKNNIYINLEPSEWRQSIRSEHGRRYNGRGLQVSARVVDAEDVELLNTDAMLNGIVAHLGIQPGTPTSGDGKPFEDGIGMFAFNEKNPGGVDYGPTDAMIVGWFFLDDEDYQDLWHQIAGDTYVSSSITLSVGPVIFKSVPEWAWDVAKNHHLIIESASISFSRHKIKKEEPPQKRGFFG
jgi:hypothetical protein